MERSKRRFLIALLLLVGLRDRRDTKIIGRRKAKFGIIRRFAPRIAKQSRRRHKLARSESRVGAVEAFSHALFGTHRRFACRPFALRCCAGCEVKNLAEDACFVVFRVVCGVVCSVICGRGH